jgi:isocitrate dehydrogenase
MQLTNDVAIAVRKITRSGCRRFADSVSKYALSNGYNRVVAITKRNILKTTDGVFWEEIFASNERAGIGKVDEIYIDNIMQQLVLNPEQFNQSILASTNLFMDIVSELAAGITGSIGLQYSSNMGDSYAMFEAAHGSAPTIKGQNVANPTASILAGAWMAEYLGEKDLKDAIFDACRTVINDGKYVTPDIGGNATTTQMTDAICQETLSRLGK